MGPVGKSLLQNEKKNTEHQPTLLCFMLRGIYQKYGPVLSSHHAIT